MWRHPLVLLAEMHDRLRRVHVEHRLADRLPVAAGVSEYRRRQPQVADGLHALHRPAFDGLERDGDGHEREQFAGPAVAGQFQGVVERAVLPPQSARLAGGGGRLEKPRLQPFTLQPERLAGAGDDHFPAEPPQRPQRQDECDERNRGPDDNPSARRHGGILSRPRIVAADGRGPYLQEEPNRGESMVERRIELGRSYRRTEQMRKLKRKLGTAKTDGDREKVLQKIRALSPFWTPPQPEKAEKKK